MIWVRSQLRAAPAQPICPSAFRSLVQPETSLACSRISLCRSEECRTAGPAACTAISNILRLVTPSAMAMAWRLRDFWPAQRCHGLTGIAAQHHECSATCRDHRGEVMSGWHVVVYVICCLHFCQLLAGQRSLIVAQYMSYRPHGLGSPAAICIETTYQTSLVLSACAEDHPSHNPPK